MNPGKIMMNTASMKSEEQLQMQEQHEFDKFISFCRLL